MKTFFLSICMGLFLQSCGGEIKSDSFKKTPSEKQEYVAVDVYSLTFHKQFGTCDTQPITHRMLTFAPIYLDLSGVDHFIGTLDVIIDEQTKTYQALYRELPGSNNSDQSQFQTVLNGTFKIEKAVEPLTNDKLILENIGTVTPTLKNKTITFMLEVDGNINRDVKDPNISGRVAQTETSLIADNCLL